MDFSKLFPIVKQVESGGNPDAVSPKGAVGVMQTMPATLRDPGFGVRPAKDASPAELERVGQDYLKAMYSKYEGNLSDALAAYNWGPGKVDQWRAQGGDVSKLPKETRDYINKITSAFDGMPGATVRSIDNAAERLPSKAEYGAALAASVQGRFLRASDYNDVAAERRVAADAEARALKEEARPSTWEQFGAGVAGSGMVRLANGITDMLFAEEFQPQPGFVPDMKALPPSSDPDLVVDYGTSKSPQEAEKHLRKFEEEQFRVKTLMDDGASKGIALSFAAELTGVQNWVVPFGVSKALGAAGAASIRGQVVENLLSGTAVEAVTQALEGKFRPQDLAISLAADGLIGVGIGVANARAASHAEASRIMGQAQAEAVQTETRLAAQAEKELGPLASADDLAKQMDIIRAREVHTAVTEPVAATSKVLAIDETPAFSGGVDAAVNLDKAVPARMLETSADRVVIAGGLSPDLQRAAKAIESMADLLPAGVRVAVGKIESNTVRGAVVSDANTVRLGLSEVGNAGGRGVETAMHEMTHAITDFYFPNVAPEIKQAVLADYAKFVRATEAGNPDAVLMRWADKRRAPVGKATVTPTDKYEIDFGEWAAEQGVRYFRQDAAGANKTGFVQDIVATMKEWVAKVWSWFTGAKELGHLPPTQSFADFLDAVVAGRVAPVAEPKSMTQYSVQPGEVVDDILTDPAAVKYGLNLAPVATAADRAKVQAMLALHKKAEAWAVANPMDERYLKAVQNLADNSVFNVASTGLLMLKSPSPLVRMIASELLEDASGVQGKRRATAAISKWTVERLMMGNALNDVQGAYAFWKKDKPGGFKDDMVGGFRWAAFNKEIAAEIETRRVGGAGTSDPNVKAAADSLQAAYQRIANEQRRVGTLGSEGLALSSKGYMPHRMNAKAVLELSNAKKQVVHNALVDQFITIEGWDASFSDMLASKYMQRVQARASGDWGSTIGGGNTSTASLVEEALRSMDLPADVIDNHMKSYAKGAANFTKSRTDLDLLRTYDTPEGEFRLLDIFDTDQTALLRAQAGRASGEVALTKFGVQGKPGLQLLRDAMQYGADGARAANPEREAFDQIAAEFMNEPFGTAGGKWMERAMSANTLVRLGGVGFNQLAESINAIFHIGAANAAATVAAIPRLRAEITALARGEKVDNAFLTSIEHTSGAEFGTDAYKVVMPFDSPDHAYPTYGQDTLTLTDRLLRGGTHAQAMLSGWRLIHSAQQRGMAEQIVKKIARYVKEGKDDVALEQFGVHAGLRDALRKDIDKVSQFDAQGNPLGFDVTKITDEAVREELIQAVWRGTAQIIQGTFIGERGKWAHDGWLKMLTQFRTFSITSMEKQWGRQRNSRGSFAAYGLLVGSMSMAVPIYMARVYANSIGRPDQEDYIEQRMQPQHLARATLNYVAMSGMAGDFIDLTTAALPDSMGLSPTGGRTGVESTFVGNYVAPSLSLVDDIWKYVQSPDDMGEAAKLLPGSRIPYLLPFVNATQD